MLDILVNPLSSPDRGYPVRYQKFDLTSCCSFSELKRDFESSFFGDTDPSAHPRQ
ncbi:unnamed protein product, partial [Ceratitis capitata]